MKTSILLVLMFAMIGASGCSHMTAMSDPALQGLFAGRPLEENAVQDATKKWPQDVVLIEMQQAFALLRDKNQTKETRQEAKGYLARAVASFDDLKLPNNFSTAFTADANTPYRGRPYERVLASMFLGILDVADGRCDMAIPAFKTAEFLDARWQPFQFGSDAPLVYALTLRCLEQTNASSGDIARAKEGLFRSIRLLEGVETLRTPLEATPEHLELQPVARQIAYLIVDAGISSSLMESPMDANGSDILDRIVSDSILFYGQVLADSKDPMHEVLQPYAKTLEKELGVKESTPSAQNLIHVTNALKELISEANRNFGLVSSLHSIIKRSRLLSNSISESVTRPKAILYFTGKGPGLISQGEHEEIAKVIPSNEEAARPGVDLVKTSVKATCGFHRYDHGALEIVFCADDADPKSTSTKMTKWQGAKLWSSSYQATSMVGRRFDSILKGRAQFRTGAQTAAAIGAATAVALMDAGNSLARTCRGSSCKAAQNLQLAGALAGLFAGGAWLAGQAVNPKADIRHLTDTFESGYLMLRSEQ